MPENNRRQAYVPAGSLAISNPVGTAPAFIKETDGGPIISLPGVPRELKYLVGHEVIPWLQERFELSRQGLTYRVLKVVGIGESKVDRIIGDLIGTGEDPEVGLMASMGEIKIRIAARAGDREGAESIIAPVEREIRSRLGPKVFGQDEETLESVIEALLQRKGLTLGLLETFTGGMAALRFNQLPSSQLLEARVVLQKDRVARMLPEGGRGDGDEIAMMTACRMRDEAGADAGLAILGFPEKTGKGLILKGNAAAVTEGSEKRFSWEMGGDLLTLQVRGTIIGLNTLRLTLLNSS
jgi:nicotinamide-nucleotide amidase